MSPSAWSPSSPGKASEPRSRGPLSEPFEPAMDRSQAATPDANVRINHKYLFAPPGYCQPVMTARFDGQSVLVTGAASGNGRAIARKFAEEGADVTVSDIQEEPRMGGDPTHEVIAEMGREVQFVECDVSDPEDLHAAVEAHVETFGSLD